MPKEAKQKTPRAKSAYIFFTMDKRPEVVQQNPDMKQKDILKELARLWKEVSDEEKEKYQKMADEDKARVAEEKKNMPASEKSSKKQKKTKKAPSDSDEGEGDDDDDDDDDE